MKPWKNLTLGKLSNVERRQMASSGYNVYLHFKARYLVKTLRNNDRNKILRIANNLTIEDSIEATAVPTKHDKSYLINPTLFYTNNHI